MTQKIASGLSTLTPATFTRVQGQTDMAYDFYSKNIIIHGYIYKGVTVDQTLANSQIWFIGPVNEITLQAIGTGTVAVQGSLDGVNFVTANPVTSADGLTRVQSKYRAFKFALTAVSGTASLVMMTS